MAANINIQELDSGIELLDPAGGRQVRLRFHGPFEGREVVWEATFCITPPNQPNAIEIGAEGVEQIPLTVTLALPCFDLPAIRKTVIMIRQYKRLHRGVQQFGGASGAL